MVLDGTSLRTSLSYTYEQAQYMLLYPLSEFTAYSLLAGLATVPMEVQAQASAAGVYNSSVTPSNLPWNTYNYCNAPHVNKAHYDLPPQAKGGKAELVYLNMMMRHHKARSRKSLMNMTDLPLHHSELQITSYRMRTDLTPPQAGTARILFKRIMGIQSYRRGYIIWRMYRVGIRFWRVYGMGAVMRGSWRRVGWRMLLNMERYFLFGQSGAMEDRDWLGNIGFLECIWAFHRLRNTREYIPTYIYGR